MKFSLPKWWPRHQVTRTGLAYAVALLLVAIAAFISANNLLFLIFAAMLATFLISSFVSRMGLAGLELDLLIPEHVSARHKTRAAVRLKNTKRWMPSFSIHLTGADESGLESALYFPVLPGAASLEEPVNVYFPRRGVQKQRSFQLSTRFPFGFTERREMVTLRHEIVIYPCLEPQPAFEDLLASVAGDWDAMQQGRGSDFYRIRPYEALESVRHLDWKATAHTGDLQIREFAREEDQKVLIYLDLDVGREHESWFEQAIEGAAFLAHHLAARGVPVRFKTQTTDVTLGANGDIYTVLKYLAVVTPIEGTPAVLPKDDHSVQLVFTAHPQRMTGLGAGSRILAPENVLPSAMA